MARDLSPRAQKFAELYAGNGAEAARRAGFGGGPGSHSAHAARLLKDERVIAIIEARRARGEVTEREDDAAPASTAGPLLPTSSAADAYRAVIADPTIAMGVRLRAIERLERLEAAAHGNDDLESYQAKLRAKVAAILAHKRARDRAAAKTKGRKVA